MDLTTAFKSEVFRPVMAIVVPGFLAIAPYVIVAEHYVPRVGRFWTEHDGAFVAIVTVCVLATGLILESVGALAESHVLDGSLGKANPTHLAEWEQYLQLRIKDEIIGQRYLRSLLTHLKFELSMIPALVVLWAGLLWVNALYHTWPWTGFLLVTLFLWGLTAYLAWESFQSAGNLAKTRRLIIAAAKTGVKTSAA